jgi:hypothetical protein
MVWRPQGERELRSTRNTKKRTNWRSVGPCAERREIPQPADKTARAADRER